MGHLGCMEICFMATGQKTKYPGIFRLGRRAYRVRVRRTDPKTGRRKEKDRILDDVDMQQALRVQRELLDELEAEIRGYSPIAENQTVGEFAQSWIDSKAGHLDPETLDRYALTLRLHILPPLGDYEYRSLTRFDVQQWVDRAMRLTYLTGSGIEKQYSVSTVQSWFRVLRNMTQDAMDPLGIERDPTVSIRFADAPDSAKSCDITAEQLRHFLRLMKERYPQHYALVVVLAFTGMRWCHASALKWDDCDENAAVLTIRRKQVRRRVGPVTRKKRAPQELPLPPNVAAVLRWHHQWMLRNQAPGFAEGWMFPSKVGTLRASSSISKAWEACRNIARIPEDFTPHGLRYTFTDLTRLIDADPIARREITGHVTERMQRKYSTVRLPEKRAIMSRVHSLVPLDDDDLTPQDPAKGGTRGD